jgi:bifunctional non-homologous end joining protein LigD
MSLETYRRKRDFGKTPEPADKKHARAAKRLSFVVQKHAARRLHYDFRLEMGGALASWAVPKGPSLNPKERRLAVEVEDHPLEYGDFEGSIPQGEYGAGSVIVWDRGSWIPDGDPIAGRRKGRLKFRLNGEKLKGGWTLVRMKPRDRNTKASNWLLIKEADQNVSRSDIVNAQPQSVKSGQGLEREDSNAGTRRSRKRRAGGETNRRQLKNAKKSKMPAFANGSSCPGTQIAGIKLTHPNRVLYPEQGITKIELASYYEGVADRIMPHIERRPLTLVRCPEGHEQQCFYQRHAQGALDPEIHQVKVKGKGSVVFYLAIDSLAGLIALVQMGVLEIHTWGARSERIEQPDQIIFDLDPDPTVGWSALKQAALSVRKRLTDLGLPAFLKTTGGKGLHVAVPIVPQHDWSFINKFTKTIAQSVVRENPERLIATMSKAKRKGKIFIDYLRNAKTATAVCAYSTRARSGAPVSTPLRWEELQHDVRGKFTIRTVPERVARLKRDPWDGFEAARAALTDKMLKQL